MGIINNLFNKKANVINIQPLSNLTREGRGSIPKSFIPKFLYKPQHLNKGGQYNNLWEKFYINAKNVDLSFTRGLVKKGNFVVINADIITYTGLLQKKEKQEKIKIVYGVVKNFMFQNGEKIKEKGIIVVENVTHYTKAINIWAKIILNMLMEELKLTKIFIYKIVGEDLEKKYIKGTILNVNIVAKMAENFMRTILNQLLHAKTHLTKKILSLCVENVTLKYITEVLNCEFKKYALWKESKRNKYTAIEQFDKRRQRQYSQVLYTQIPVTTVS